MLNKHNVERKLYDVMANCGIYNKRKEMLKIKTIQEENYGYHVILSPVPGIGYDQIEKNIKVIQDSFPCLLEYKKFNQKNKDNAITGNLELNLVLKEFKKKDFEVITFKDGHYLYAGNKINGEPLIIDMNTFPHLLISGLPGSGKTRLLLCILFSLIYGTDKVQLYLTQIRKRDLNILKDFPAVKRYATTVEDAENMFRDILAIGEEREALFDETGCINIADYNKQFPDKALNYIVLVAEELATFMPNDADESERKDSKKSCIATLLESGQTGRSAGIFIIGCLQRTTADNVAPSLKYLLQNKITFNMGNTISSNNVIESEMAVGLGLGETIYFNGGEYRRALVPWLTDKKIKELASHPEDTIRQTVETIQPIKKAYTTPPSVRIDTTSGDGRRFVEEYKLSSEDKQAYIEEVRRKREAKFEALRIKQKEKEEKVIIEAAIKETKADINIAEAIEEELAEKIDYSKVPAPSTPPAPPKEKEIIIRDERRMPTSLGQMEASREPSRNNRRNNNRRNNTKGQMR